MATHSSTEAEGIIHSYIANRLLPAHGRPDETFTSDTSLFRTGIVDSFGLFELVEYVEQQFGITVGDEDVVPDNFESIATIVRFVGERQRSQLRSSTNER